MPLPRVVVRRCERAHRTKRTALLSPVEQEVWFVRWSKMVGAEVSGGRRLGLSRVVLVQCWTGKRGMWTNGDRGDVVGDGRDAG
jgi:hypothetical protein